MTNHETPNTSAADAEKRPATLEQNEPIAETHRKGDNKDVLIARRSSDRSGHHRHHETRPAPGRPSNPNRLASVKYALAGLLYVLTHEQSIQWATLVTLIVLVLGMWLDDGDVELGAAHLGAWECVGDGMREHRHPSRH